MTNLTENEKQEAKMVQELAQANYRKAYGWQVIVECMTDEEVIEEIKDSGMPSLKWAHWFAALQSERMEEVQAEIFQALDAATMLAYSRVVRSLNGE